MPAFILGGQYGLGSPLRYFMVRSLVLFFLVTTPAFACDTQTLAKQDSLLREYRMLYRQTKAIADNLSSASDIPRLCSSARREEEVMRKWMDIDSYVRATCPSFWQYAQSSGAGSDIVRSNYEKTLRGLELCNKDGL